MIIIITSIILYTYNNNNNLVMTTRVGSLYTALRAMTKSYLGGRIIGMLKYVYDVCVCTFSALSACADLLSFLASLPSQIAQSYRYQYDDGYAHANADP